MDTTFLQVSPPNIEHDSFKRSSGQTTAAVLIQGLRLHLFNGAYADRPMPHSWQMSGSLLVETLSKRADIFAFAYSQNVAIDAIASQPGLGEGIQRLRELGYTDIVLIGHSAGGLIARQFVEDQPDTGVTKVIQVCTPNSGAAWARIEWELPRNQRSFVSSLGKAIRNESREERTDKKIPRSIEFVCVLGNGAGGGDCIVSNNSQWPSDLQEQGIPVVPIPTTHFTVMRSRKAAEKISEILAGHFDRWDQEKVDEARKELGKK